MIEAFLLGEQYDYDFVRVAGRNKTILGEQHMKLTVLMDNHTYIDQYYLGEPAVCYLIEDGDHVILLDTGYSDAV